MNVGLVHDYLLVRRGAERTFEELAAAWPGAPIYTTLYDPEGTEGRFSDREVVTSSLQVLRLRQRGFRALLPLFPHAVRGLPVDHHDIVISSSSAFAHGVSPRSDAFHLCYCHTPFRYAWQERERVAAALPRPLAAVIGRQLDAIRRWDLDAAQRVSEYVANSEITRTRIGEFYGREARVVHPPVDTERFFSGAPADYLLVVSELLAHKRIEVAIDVAHAVGRPLVVVGDGPERRRLQGRRPGTARFVGRVGDRELAELYAGAFAMLVPNEEEFGIAAVEAQASGCPVVALAAGGVLETIVDGETGILVEGGGVSGLAEAVRAIEGVRPSVEACRRQAERFSRERFVTEMREIVSALAH